MVIRLNSVSSKDQTDNSCFASKVRLRLDSLDFVSTPEPRVLECFGGEGLLWKEVSRISGKTIKSLRIDEKKDLPGYYLQGNNLKILPTLDLSTFDIIDLDAYGVPWDQLAILKDLGYSGVLHITHIHFGSLPYSAIEYLGITREMISKSPMLYHTLGITPVKAILYDMGYRKIHYYQPTVQRTYLWAKKDLP